MTDITSLVGMPPRPETARKARRFSAFVLAFGASLFGLVFLAVIATPMLVRDSVVAPIDSYFYIAKGEQLLSCPMQDCPALTDLLQQGTASETGDETVDEDRRKLLQRVHYMYHAAHSAGLAILSMVGIDWETGLNILSLIGAALVAAGLIALLYTLWGAGPAGLALAFLAFEVFPGFHGLHWIVPSTFALGLGLCLWSAVLIRPRWLDVALPVAVLLLVWMHPVGRAYAALGLALYLFLMPWREKRAWTVLAVAGFAWTTPGLTAITFPGPTFSSGAFLVPEGWNYWQGVVDNGRSALSQILDRFANPTGVIMLVGAGIGLVATPLKRRRVVWLTVGLLFSMAAASLLHMLPGYPAELFRRLWVPLMVVIAGGFGHAIWMLFTNLWKTSRVEHSIRMRIGIGIGVLAAMLIFVQQIQIGVPAVIGKTAHMVLWGKMSIDTTQPERVLPTVASDKRILYMDELSLYQYLARGGTPYSSVYYPAIAGTEREPGWLTANIDIAVTTIPPFYGKIHLPEGGKIDITFETEVPRDTIRLRIDNPHSGSTVLEIDGFKPVSIDRKWRGWVTLTPMNAGPPVNRLSIDVEDGGFTWISGLRVDGRTTTTWPWYFGMTIRKPNPDAGTGEKPANENTVLEARFSPDALLPDTCRMLDIIDDTGATIVMRVACGQ